MLIPFQLCKFVVSVLSTFWRAVGCILGSRATSSASYPTCHTWFNLAMSYAAKSGRKISVAKIDMYLLGFTSPVMFWTTTSSNSLEGSRGCKRHPSLVSLVMLYLLTFKVPLACETAIMALVPIIRGLFRRGFTPQATHFGVSSIDIGMVNKMSMWVSLWMFQPSSAPKVSSFLQLVMFMGLMGVQILALL
ncbi:hypothetical protein RchiOBHm_Chr5g0040861 [Rosa chinensis]|uniref:Uncharacterized protein n=1 Tax=Rosa chinensis TaxID=74649 RepID=A0A2P6QCM3_ROSCH|nr:hypothetical protein RchiOBHm_Chr5g0040861 [Rosa chinensis]